MINMFRIKNRIRLKTQDKSLMKAVKDFKPSNPASLFNNQNKIKRYNDADFIEFRTKALSKAISESASTNSIVVFKEQISDLRFLSIMFADEKYFNMLNDLAILSRIIDFVERSKSLFDLKYTEDIWKIMTELYKLKTMITNLHIYNIDEARKQAYEIINYTNEHLI